VKQICFLITLCLGGYDHTFSLYLRRDSSSASWIDTEGMAGSVLVIREGRAAESNCVLRVMMVSSCNGLLIW